MYVEGDGQYQQVGKDVKTSDAHQDLGVIERYLLGDLHHAEDDHQIGAGKRCQSGIGHWGLRHALWDKQDSDSTYICGLTMAADEQRIRALSMSDVDDTGLTGGCRRFDVNCFNATNLRNRWPVPEFQDRCLPRNAPKLTLTLSRNNKEQPAGLGNTGLYFTFALGVRLPIAHPQAISTEYRAKARHRISHGTHSMA